MSADISSELDQPTMRATTSKTLRDNVMRIVTMTQQLLDEVRTQAQATAGLTRLRGVDTQKIGELLTDLTPDLRGELHRLTLPLTRHTELSDAELRRAYAQLEGWLQGLLKTAQTALSDPHAVLAADWTTGRTAEDTSMTSNIPTSPNHFDQRDVEPCISTNCPPDDISPSGERPAIRRARQTLITAITERIAQQRLTAAQAAAALHLTGPRVTQLLQANVEEFTLDELVNLLPALQLTIQIAPAPAHDIGHSRQRPND
jgi:predicted XRE-type DNA-binding protein